MWNLNLKIRSTLRPILSLFLLMSVNLSTTAVNGQERLRVWEDFRGKKITAKLIDVQSPIVVLRRSDGTIAKHHVDDFCRRDQKRLKNWTERQNNWLQRVKVGTWVRVRTNYGDYEGGFHRYPDINGTWPIGQVTKIEGPEVEVSFDSLPGRRLTYHRNQLVLYEESISRSVTFDAATLNRDFPDEELELITQPIPVGAIPNVKQIGEAKFELGQTSRPIGFLRFGNGLLVSSISVDESTLLFCDPATGQVTRQTIVPAQQYPLAINQQGNVLVTLTRFNSRHFSRYRRSGDYKTPQWTHLQILRLDNQGNFQPDYRIDRGSASSILRCYFDSRDRLVFGSQNGTIIWDVDQEKPIRVIGGAPFSVNPSGTLLASPVDWGIKYGIIPVFPSSYRRGTELFDLSNGKSLGGISRSTGMPCFSPDGSRIAVVDNDVCNDVLIHELADPSKKPIKVYLPRTSRIPPVWTSNRHLLVGQEFLIDTQKGCIVWRYTRSHALDPSIDKFFYPLFLNRAGSRLCYLDRRTKDGVATAVVANVPSDTVLRKIKEREAGNFALEPGSPIQILVNVDPKSEDAIHSKLEELCKRSDWKVQKKAKTKISGSIRRDGKFVVRIIFRNQVVLEIAEDSRLRNHYRDPRYSTLEFGSRGKEVEYFLDKLELPSTMAAAEYMAGFGHSVITPDGIIDDKK